MIVRTIGPSGRMRVRAHFDTWAMNMSRNYTDKHDCCGHWEVPSAPRTTSDSKDTAPLRDLLFLFRVQWQCHSQTNRWGGTTGLCKKDAMGCINLF
eukprot:scaffold2203_cov176-Amphora_coffeaeformis.AAC.2